MKQIIRNRYLKGFKFSSSEECSFFFGNQKTQKKVSFENTFGDNYYCYVCYNSLTSELEFALSFSSEEEEDTLSFLFWDDHNLLVLDTGNTIYFIDEKLVVKSSFEILTPLIGIHLINSNNLLLLEEAQMRIVDNSGRIIENELFDLIESFTIDNNILYIQAGGENKIFKLD